MEEQYRPDEVSPETDPIEGTTGFESPAASYVAERFSRSKTARYTDEARWLTSYRAFRGIYGPDVQFSDQEKSKVFVKVTKTKVVAAYQQITDVLFGNGKFPLTIDPTTLPEGVSESVHFSTDPNDPDVGAMQRGELPPLKPGETYDDFTKRLGVLKGKLEGLGEKVKEGPGTRPTDVTFHPALVAAKMWEKQIHDQLEESNSNKELRSAVHECALFGTGIMKGPYTINKEYPDWDEAGSYIPVVKKVPRVEYLSIWNYYNDPEAYNIEDSEFGIERHRMSRSQLRALKTRPHFDPKAIDEVLKGGYNYMDEWWETHMQDHRNTVTNERFEVLEFWGYVPLEDALEFGISRSEVSQGTEEVCLNIWVCGGHVLMLVANPYKPSYLPYYVVPYEHNPYSFFGIGVAENMDDTQMLMNGFMRMAVDNAMLSGNMIFDVDEDSLSPGQDLKVYPGKIFRRRGGAPGQSIVGIKFPNVSNENMQLFDKARVLADESTGFPSFAHGQTGVQGVGRTASGISMLMDAASGAIKSVVKNFDDFLLQPMGEALFNYNKQYNNPRKIIVGDLAVKARGTESLMSNEIRSQRLLQFLQLVQNPVLAPFAKLDQIIAEIAKTMGLDPEKVTNNMADAAIQAELIRKMSPEAMGVAPQEAQGISATDPTGAGGGNMGTGSVPTPGTPGFSAAGGGGAAGMPQAPAQGQPQ